LRRKEKRNSRGVFAGKLKVREKTGENFGTTENFERGGENKKEKRGATADKTSLHEKDRGNVHKISSLKERENV